MIAKTAVIKLFNTSNIIGCLLIQVSFLYCGFLKILKSIGDCLEGSLIYSLDWIMVLAIFSIIWGDLSYFSSFVICLIAQPTRQLPSFSMLFLILSRISFRCCSVNDKGILYFYNYVKHITALPLTGSP